MSRRKSQSSQRDSKDRDKRAIWNDILGRFGTLKRQLLYALDFAVRVREVSGNALAVPFIGLHSSLRYLLAPDGAGKDSLEFGRCWRGLWREGFTFHGNIVEQSVRFILSWCPRVRDSYDKLAGSLAEDQNVDQPLDVRARLLGEQGDLREYAHGRLSVQEMHTAFDPVDESELKRLKERTEDILTYYAGRCPEATTTEVEAANRVEEHYQRKEANAAWQPGEGVVLQQGSDGNWELFGKPFVPERPAQKRVLDLLIDNRETWRTAKQIADACGLATSTVESHISRIRGFVLGAYKGELRRKEQFPPKKKMKKFVREQLLLKKRAGRSSSYRLNIKGNRRTGFSISRASATAAKPGKKKSVKGKTQGILRSTS